MPEAPQFEVHGDLSDEATEALAMLLLSMSDPEDQRELTDDEPSSSPDVETTQ